MTKYPPISEEDKALFRAAVQKITINKKKTADPAVEAPDFYLSDSYSEAVGAETILSYRQPGFPERRFSAFKKGHIPYELTLDLHGKNSDEAKEALLTCLMKTRALGKRCLLIIHGKGGRYQKEAILKSLVNHWLPQIPEVLAFHSALARDGGNGAIYVLVRRLNSSK